MFKQSHLLLLKYLFGALLILTLVLGWGISSDIRIDTNLNELNPQNQHSPQTKAAIEALGDNIQRRVLLLVSGTDEDSVFDASDQLREKLSDVSSLSLHPDAELIADNLLDTLKPYRFALLTEQQRKALVDNDTQAIINEAKESMFGLSSIRFYPFNEDPLGWHSAFIQDLFASLQSPESNSDSFHSVVSFSIEEGAMDMQRQEILSNQLDTIGNQVKKDHDISIERSGVFFFAADAATSSKQDISLISTGSTIGVVLLLLLAFRSLWSLVLPVASVLLGVVFAFIVTHSIYGNVHVLTIVFGASLIGIVIDYSLHYFYHVSANAVSNKPSGNQALYRALLLSLLTSLIGYSALSFSGLAALQKVAVFSCCGLLMAWLSVVCIGEFCTRKHLSLDQVVLPRLERVFSQSVAKINNSLWLVVSAMVIVTALWFSQIGNAFNDDPRLFFKASEKLLQSERAVAEVANDYEPGRYLIVQGQTESDIYSKTTELLTVLKSDPEFEPSRLTTLVNWVPSIEQQEQNYQRQKTLYKERGIAQALIEQVGGSAELTSTLQQEYQSAQNIFVSPVTIAELLSTSTPPLWITDEQLITSFMLIHKGSNTETIAAAAEQVAGVEFVNTLQRTSDALQQQRYSASKLLAFAYLLIALLLSLRYRSIKTASMLLVPLTASALVLLVCLSFGQTLNLFHVMALFLVLGFGMDYVIFTREIDDQRSITLQAILLSAITSLLSFGLLSISSIPVAQSFGMTLLIGNCFNLLGVFVYSHCIGNNQARGH